MGKTKKRNSRNNSFNKNRRITGFVKRARTKQNNNKLKKQLLLNVPIEEPNRNHGNETLANISKGRHISKGDYNNIRITCSISDDGNNSNTVIALDSSAVNEDMLNEKSLNPMFKTIDYVGADDDDKADNDVDKVDNDVNKVDDDVKADDDDDVIFVPEDSDVIFVGDKKDTVIVIDDDSIADVPAPTPNPFINNLTINRLRLLPSPIKHNTNQQIVNGPLGWTSSTPVSVKAATQHWIESRETRTIAPTKSPVHFDPPLHRPKRSERQRVHAPKLSPNVKSHFDLPDIPVLQNIRRGRQRIEAPTSSVNTRKTTLKVIRNRNVRNKELRTDSPKDGDGNARNAQPERTRENDLPPNKVLDNKFGCNFLNAGNVRMQGLRPIFIDGTNVAMRHSNGKFFSVKGLQICIDYFKLRGHEVTAIVPLFRRKIGQNSNSDLLHKLEKDGDVIFTPARRINGKNIVPYDDRYIVLLAHVHKGIVVSSDNFRDLLQEEPSLLETIENRMLTPIFVKDMIIFPSDPLGRHGPKLDDFLKFPESPQ